jgi:broad specificity phosphatase PhoE
VPADLVRLVRHGEVHNPQGILYGRIPGYLLSELGNRMAALAAESLAGHPVAALWASPLERTQESAKPWAALFGLEPRLDERLIEPTNWFEGTTVRRKLRDPRSWVKLRDPNLPSWGEPYAEVRERMFSVLDEAADSVDGGEVVMVSHQMPIVTVQRSVAGQRLPHNPARRRCALSSITTLERRGGVWLQVDYQEPAGSLLATSTDTGAV